MASRYSRKPQKKSMWVPFFITKRVKKYFFKKRRNGFTMIEVIIAFTIVGLMTTAGLVGFQASQQKGHDARRKSDLQEIKTAMEDYYNDNECYPPEGTFDQCGSDSFRPYLQQVPCDPKDHTPYLYKPLTDQCAGYRLQAKLEKLDDPIIAELGCNGTDGCGYGDEYNYGVASGVAVYDASGTASTGGGEESPGPSGPVYVYACDQSGVCNQFEEGHPTLLTCPVTYQQSNCNNECYIPAVRCQ